MATQTTNNGKNDKSTLRKPVKLQGEWNLNPSSGYQFRTELSVSKQEKDSIMITAAKENSTVNESMDANVARQEATLFQNKLSGNFIGVNDGIHNAEGVAKVIVLDDGTNVLRLENFKATNGPDLMFI